MSEITLYDIIQDDNEKCSLIETNKYEVFDNMYDENLGTYVMTNLLHLNILENEHLYIIATNSKQEISGIYHVSVGTYNTTQVYKRNILLFLALVGAKGFADYHNHPNNIVQSSQDDIISEAELSNISKLLEIPYYGSYIIGRKQYIKVGDKKAKLIEEA